MTIEWKRFAPQVIGMKLFVFFTLMVVSVCVRAEGSLHTIFTNGMASNRVNIVFLAESYTADQENQFVQDATAAFQNLLSADPYLEYKSYFNAYAIFVASEQSGTTHYQYGLNKHTYFNSSYDAATDRIITIPPNDVDSNYSHGRGKVDALIASLAPQCTLPVILVNDYVDGGAGGPLTLVSVGPTEPETLMHELAHSFADLGDEYSSAGTTDYTADEHPNTTRETRRNYIKWKAWIDSTTPIPTTTTYSNYESCVGLFLGANYQTTGWYRPKYTCRMKDMMQPFCEVCTEALITSIYGKVRPVDSFTPATNNLTVRGTESCTLSLNLMSPLTHSLSVQWTINGTAISGATNATLDVSDSVLTNGLQVIAAHVLDPTSAVRNDPSNLLSQTISWNVTGSGLPLAPQIVLQPTNQVVRAGSLVQVTVESVGKNPLLYQWRFNGADLTDETNSILTLTNIQPAMAGAYSVVVSNDLGRVISSNAVLTVTIPLTVQVEGPGSVTPANTPQWLVPGTRCKLTAKAQKGCHFNGWTGDIVTNKTTFQFRLLAATTLTANFTDTTKPTLTIASPANKARVTNNPIVMIGTAKDNAGLSLVQYRVNNGAFSNATTTNQWTNWTASFAPVPGTNVFEAVSIDNFSNQSASVTRQLTYVIYSPITLTTDGAGSITPNLNGQLLEIGKTFKFTATPVKNNLFAGWSNGSRSNVLSIVMQSNLTLQASFVTNPFISMKGTYKGLSFTNACLDTNSVGAWTLTVTDQGKFSGKYTGADSYSLSGNFWVDGTAQLTLSKAKRPSMTLTLQLDLTQGTDQITGELTDGNWRVPVLCDRAVFDGKTLIASEAGTYTMAFLDGTNDTVPQFGAGYGKFTVKANGTIQFSGVLADGTVITQTTVVAKDGRWPLFAGPYKGRGYLAGWLQFTNEETGCLSGEPIWVKQAFKTTSYGQGLTNTLQTIGSTYNAKAKPVLNLENPEAFFWGASLNEPITFTAIPANTNALSYSGTNSLKLTVTSSSGLISGKFAYPTTQNSMTIKGVILQQVGFAAGFFQSTNQSGLFELRNGQ